MHFRIVHWTHYKKLIMLEYMGHLASPWWLVSPDNDWQPESCRVCNSPLADSLSAAAQLCFSLLVSTVQYLLSGRLLFYSTADPKLLMKPSKEGLTDNYFGWEKTITANRTESNIKSYVNLGRSVLDKTIN